MCIIRAVCYDIKYPDFAECEYNRVTGYLPRIKRSTNILLTTEILEEKEARELSKLSFKDRRLALYDLELKKSEEAFDYKLIRK